MNVRRRSIRQENEAAKKYGGRRRPASGALPGLGGDLTAYGKKLLVECKLTEKGSYSISAEAIDKHEKHATLEGRDWFWLISFISPLRRRPREIVILDGEFFRELMESHGNHV